MQVMCPKCKTSDGLREFIYGLPAGPPDETKYVLGGCTPIPDTRPDFLCLNCNWSGSLNSKETERELDSWEN